MFATGNPNKRMIRHAVAMAERCQKEVTRASSQPHRAFILPLTMVFMRVAERMSIIDTVHPKKGIGTVRKCVVECEY